MKQLTKGSPQTSEDAPLSGFLESIGRHKARFFGVFGFIFLLTMVYVFFSHKKYESDMSVVVQNARRPEVLTAGPTAATQAFVTQVTEDQVYSQVEILGSNNVLDEVADPGWDSVPVTSHTRAQQLAHQDKVYAIRKHLDIEPVRKSDVIDVSYRANDPKVATDTLKRVLTAFLAREQVVSEPMGASKFFNQEAEDYQKRWAAAQKELADYQQAHQIVSISDQETQLQTALQETQVLQRAADADLVANAQRLRVENAEHAKTPPRQRTTETVVPAAGSVDQVNTLLAQLDLRRAQLLTEYRPTDPIVQQVDQQIREAKQELANSQALASTQRSTAVNPTWQMQDEAILQDKASLRAVEARKSAIDAQVKSLEQQLKTTESETVTYTSLQQKVAELQADYQLYLQKRDAATISEAMNEQGMVNIGVAQSPTFSLSPVRPRPFLDSILGGMTALFMACFAVYLAEAGRQTISTQKELSTVSSYPLLATVSLGPDAPIVRWNLPRSRFAGR